MATDITLLKLGKTITKLLFDGHVIFEKFSIVEEASEDILRLICKTFSWNSGEIWLFSKNNNDTSTCVSQWPAKNNLLSEDIEDKRSKSAKNDETDRISLIDSKIAITLPIAFKDKQIGKMNFYINKSLLIDVQIMEMITQALAMIASRLGEFYEHKYSNKQLAFVSSHDSLTGLMNRYSFAEQVNQAILIHPDNEFVIILIDIDKLKTINNALGYLVGDKIILSVSDKLLYFTRKIDGYISKMGADKFALLLHKNISKDVVAEYSQQLLKLISEPIKVNNDDVCITVSIGISVYPDNGNECITLIKNADAAMSQVKEKGGNYYQFYDSTLSPLATEKFKLINELHSAITNGQFVLHYQPKIEIKTGKIVGVEALIRWNHPERGLVLPSDFMDAIEETGLIIRISEWVLREVFQLILSRRIYDLPIAVNLSIVQFKVKYDLVAYIKKLMEELNIDGAKVEYEVTESLLMMSEQNSMLILKKLKHFGSKVSFDDFGTGYSSFSYLKYFIPDNIKIDKTFIDSLPMNHDICKIVEAMISLARNLNINVIAEGVENVEQFNYLKQCGCDQIQGFYFSKALPLDELIKLVNQSVNFIV